MSWSDRKAMRHAGAIWSTRDCLSPHVLKVAAGAFVMPNNLTITQRNDDDDISPNERQVEKATTTMQAQAPSLGPIAVRVARAAPTVDRCGERVSSSQLSHGKCRNGRSRHL